jgi:hypothetical protein
MSAAMEWVLPDQQISRWNAARVQIEPRPVTASASASAFVPAWVGSVATRLFELLRLPNNWDSYGASKPSVTSALNLFTVLSAVASPDTPAPSIVPTTLGYFQAEWHQNGADLEVEVVTPTRILVSFSDATDSWDDVLSIDMTRLAQALRRIGRAP